MKRADVPEDEVIAACRAFHAGCGETPDVALAARYPAKVVLAKMKQLEEQGKLDYGVSLRTAWPTADEAD
ncbi:hypothetical protein LCGC14_2025870 [marine sediment metagenome]|uniref:Uncharacterized protein n=1 Tax=marine sediment metagenome TaxID=412755 RepID=A0A0F9EWB9_9ZZZZ